MLDEQPQTKEAILARFATAAAALDAAIARFSDDELLEPPSAAGWSKRDVLAHIAADHRWWAGQLAAMLEGRVPTAGECYDGFAPPGSDIDMATQEGRNAWQHRETASQPLADIRRDLRFYRARVVELAEQLQASEFARDYAIGDNGFTGHVRPATEGEPGFPLWQWFRGNTWHHYEDHLESLQA